MKNYVARFALILACLAPLSAHADTLQLMTASSTSNGGPDVYPYGFSVNGSSTLTSLMCMDYNREITFGEKWAVSLAAIPLDGSMTSAAYRADAWLFSQLGANSAEDVQYAVWSIFDPTDTQKQPQFSANASKLANQAVSLTANANTLGAAFYGRYQLYLPTSDQTGWTAGIPQEFIGTAVTPEPASLAMVGTGLLGVISGVIRRRRGQVAAA